MKRHPMSPGAAKGNSKNTRTEDKTPRGDTQEQENKVQELQVALIEDGGAQARLEMRAETVNEYAADMLDGAVFPAVVVYVDSEGRHWLGDGFHRLEAARKIERKTILAEIRSGTQRDASARRVRNSTPSPSPPATQVRNSAPPPASRTVATSLKRGSRRSPMIASLPSCVGAASRSAMMT